MVVGVTLTVGEETYGTFVALLICSTEYGLLKFHSRCAVFDAHVVLDQDF